MFFLNQPGLNVHVVQQMHQPLNQRGKQGLQLETGLHQLFDAGHHCGVAGKHFALRRHHVRDEGVSSALLLQEANTCIRYHTGATSAQWIHSVNFQLSHAFSF